MEEEDKHVASKDDNTKATNESKAVLEALLEEDHSSSRPPTPDREGGKGDVTDDTQSSIYELRDGHLTPASSSRVASDTKGVEMKAANNVESSPGSGNESNQIKKDGQMELTNNVDICLGTGNTTRDNLIPSADSRMNDPKGLVSSADVNVSNELDEICRKINILPPYGKSQIYRFDNDQPISGTRKMLNSREIGEVSEKNNYVHEVPAVGRGGYRGRGRGWVYHHRMNSSLQFRSTGYSVQGAIANNRHAHPAQHKGKLQMKLKRGLETIGKAEEGINVLGDVPSSQSTSEFPKHVPSPWERISQLNEEGYGTYYVLKKLKKENESNKLQGRMFRCTIEHEGITGICEAAISYQARNGAAFDFLKKLCQQCPKVGPIPTKIPDDVLMDGTGLLTLLSKLKEIRKGYTANFEHTTLINDQGRPLFRCTMDIEPYKYEGYDYHSTAVAKLNAIKQAYEDLIKKTYPYAQLYIGETECTTEPSFYRDVESRTVHCIDLSRSTLNNPGTFQQYQAMRSQGPGGCPAWAGKWGALRGQNADIYF